MRMFLVGLGLALAALAVPTSALASSTYYAADGTLCTTHPETIATLARVAPQIRAEVLNVGPHCGGPTP